MKHLKSLVTCAMAALLGTALVSCTSQPKAERYLYLCIGQSNMVGKGIVAPEDTIPEPRFLSLSATNADDGRKVGEWRLAQSANCRPGEHYPLQVSPTDYFGRTMVEYLPENVTIGIIQVGVDGCPLRLFERNNQFADSIHPDWMEGQIASYDHNPRERLIALAKQAIEEGWNVKGLLVHQGETDAYSEYWPKELGKIYNEIREDLNITGEDFLSSLAKLSESIRMVFVHTQIQHLIVFMNSCQMHILFLLMHVRHLRIICISLQPAIVSWVVVMPSKCFS